jgi:hypothetical protein
MCILRYDEPMTEAVYTLKRSSFYARFAFKSGLTI